MLKVFYIECSGSLWRRIAEAAQKQAGWEPILWTAETSDLPLIKDAFPNTLCQDSFSAVRGIPVPGLNGLGPVALGGNELSEMSSEESLILQMMDRMDPTGTSFTYEERRFHYHQLMQYWISVLDKLNPDVIVFSIAPHVVYDYLIYVLAKRRKISTPMFDRLGLPGWVYSVGGVFDRPTEWEEAIEKSPPELNPEFRRFYDATVAGGRRAIPPNFAKKVDRLGISNIAEASITRTLWFEIKRIANIARKSGLGPISRSYQKLPGTAPAASCPTVIDFLVWRVRSVISKARIHRTIFLRRAQNPDFTRPFVLLALHFQPERATLPMGGMLGDQTLIVDMLAVTVMPLGWDVYIKEHPWQLSPYSRAEARRTSAFYQRMLRHANVRLLRTDVDTSDVIDKARAVATVTGSVGWQAICRGVPALVFGAAWYRDCPGAFSVGNLDQLNDALAHINDGPGIQQIDVERFLARIQSICVRGYLEPNVEAVSDMNEIEIAGPMAEALVSTAASYEHSR